MFNCYIIESVESRKWYYGMTEDIKRRLDGHNRGLNKSTKNRGPWKYIFIRLFETKAEAFEFEKYLKSSRNKGYIRKAFGEFFLVE